jgi:hypothetical protein
MKKCTLLVIITKRVFFNFKVKFLVSGQEVTVVAAKYLENEV